MAASFNIFTRERDIDSGNSWRSAEKGNVSLSVDDKGLILSLSGGIMNNAALRLSGFDAIALGKSLISAGEKDKDLRRIFAEGAAQQQELKDHYEAQLAETAGKKKA